MYLRTKIFNWLLVFLWMLLIFYLSDQPDLKSSLPTITDLILRKAAHIIEYAILFLLLLRVWRNYNWEFQASLFFAFFFSLLYALSDEYHQSFVAGRQGKIMDVVIDSFGALIAMVGVTKNRSVKGNDFPN